MQRCNYDIGVIGGGAAGLTVASGSAQLGAKTLLIEREEKLGGDCLHFGCVPSKTLIRSAAVYDLIKHTSLYGLPELAVPTVEYNKVATRIKSVIDTIQVHDSVERFNSLGVEVAFGDARFLDPHTVAFAGQKVTADKWLIATGSSPAIPTFAGGGMEYCLTNKDIFSLPVLPTTLVVLGAGAIGIEMAQAFCRLGSRVIVVQRSGHILSKEDADLADLVMKVLEDEGVQFILEASVFSVQEKNGNKEVVVRRKQGEELVLQASHVLAVQGRQANLDGLGLRDIGVLYTERGIEVDDRLRTSLKHIYAAGDVIGHHQFTHAAGYEGGIVLSNAILHLPRKVNYTWMPRCTYSSPEFAVLGLTEKEAQAQGLEYRLWTEDFSNNDRAQAEGALVGRIKLLLSKKGKPLGVQIVGIHAGDLLAEWVAVVNGRVKLSHLAGAVHPYPTLAEINKRVVGKYFGEKLFSDKVRKALRLIFRYQGEAI